MDRIENFPKPIIAAIHGAALGGGLELAMSCHIRIVSETAKLGLPELSLGIIPGFAGTQRLPKYVGTAKAAEMMLTAEPVSGVDAVKIGLANIAVPEEKLLDEAMKLAKKVTGRTNIAAFEKSYHGSTQGALSVMGDEYWRNAFRPLLPGISHLIYNSFDSLDEITDQTACVIVETVQAEAGILIPNKMFGPKYGCPTNGKNVGAEKLANGDPEAEKAARKAKKFKD